MKLSQMSLLHLYKSLEIDSLVSHSYKSIIGAAQCIVYNKCRSSHSCLVSSQCCRAQGHWRMMISVLYEGGVAAALNPGLRGISNTDFPVLPKEKSYIIDSYTRFTDPLPFANWPHFVSTPLVLSFQRDAQVTRREPEKAFGHQPSAQAAQVPGGWRGYQRRPQILPLSWGHQQRVDRGANIAHHRILWISALECKLQEWVTPGAVTFL